MRTQLRIALGVIAALAVGALACTPSSTPPSAHGPALELWLYQAVNFADSAEVAALAPRWRRAAAAGYTHVLLADPKFARLVEMDSTYFARLAGARRLADSLRLSIVPGVFLVGRANGLLALDPNLAEALPVRDALFEARGGLAHLVPDPPVSFGDRPEYADPWVTRTGGVAAIVDNRLPARVIERVSVAPFRCYHIAVSVRTAAFTGDPQIRVTADDRALSFTVLGVRRTQDWTTHDVVFNSLDNRRVEVRFGAFRPARGRLEWKNWRIEEAGPVNLVRRVGAPLVLTGAVEGRDVEPIHDPLMGRSPWPGQYDVWHEPPQIRTSLRDGSRFRASWFHAALVLRNQVAACISDTAVLAHLADEARRVRELFAADRMMMMHDEIRAMNWDASCVSRHASAGRLLAEHMRACRAMLGGARAYVWSDMFDPRANAREDYYLVRGDLGHSWDGLDSGVVVVNWNLGALESSLRFFAEHGHAQIIAGYYDGPVGDARHLVAMRARIPRIEGVMYTTWQNRYDDLEAFARIVNGGRSP